MSVNLAVKQKLLDKIESLSEDEVSNVLQFIDSLGNLKDNFENVTHKSWQPCNSYDAVEKLTNLLESDKLNNNEKL